MREGLQRTSVAVLVAGGSPTLGDVTLTLTTVVVAHWLAFERAGLYLSRITSVRLEEMTRVLRTVVFVGSGSCSPAA